MKLGGKLALLLLFPGLTIGCSSGLRKKPDLDSNGYDYNYEYTTGGNLRAFAMLSQSPGNALKLKEYKFSEALSSFLTKQNSFGGCGAQKDSENPKMLGHIVESMCLAELSSSVWFGTKYKIKNSLEKTGAPELAVWVDDDDPGKVKVHICRDGQYSVRVDIDRFDDFLSGSFSSYESSFVGGGTFLLPSKSSAPETNKLSKVRSFLFEKPEKSYFFSSGIYAATASSTTSPSPLFPEEWDCETEKEISVSNKDKYLLKTSSCELLKEKIKKSLNFCEEFPTGS